VACLEAILANTALPVSAKIRILDADNPAPTVALACRLADAGIQALTIHGRRWESMYSGPVAAHVIRAVQAALSIPVIANGGVRDRASAAALREASGCSRIMVARGAIGNPWIFREITGEHDTPATHEEVCTELESHVLGMVELYGEHHGLRIARKIVSAYLGGRGFPSRHRARVTSLSTLTEFRELLDTIRHEGTAPGSPPPPREHLTPGRGSLGANVAPCAPPGS
jgi:tRNA-dihydrouridine synthase B